MTDESKLFYRAGKEALSTTHILDAQKYLYCNHTASWILRPIFDALFDSISQQIYNHPLSLLPVAPE